MKEIFEIILTHLVMPIVNQGLHFLPSDHCLFTYITRPQGYKKIMLNSSEHKYYMLINVKTPTIVGILTFVSIINTISESWKA